MCRLLVERKNTGLEYYKMAVIDEIIKKNRSNSMKKYHFLPSSNHEWHVWVRNKFSTHIWGGVRIIKMEI